MNARRIPCFLLLLTLLTSCGAKVSTTRMVPAKYQVSGIKRLAVAEFKTGSTGWSGAGSYISNQVANELESDNFYESVIRGPRVGANDGFSDQLERWCKKKRVDAVIAGTVTEARINVKREYRKEEKEVKTGRYKFETYWENGQQKKRRVEIVEKRIEQIPVVEKEARIAVNVKLLDAKASISIDSDSIKDDYSEKAEGNNIRNLRHNNAIFEGIATGIASQITNNLAPHQATESIKLANDSECKEGVKLARNFNWDGAIASWKAAGPDSHCALYDLGVAAEVAKDYSGAENYYMSAIDLKDKRQYRKALERAGRKMREKEKLQRQMEGR